MLFNEDQRVQLSLVGSPMLYQGQRKKKHGFHCIPLFGFLVEGIESRLLMSKLSGFMVEEFGFLVDGKE